MTYEMYNVLHNPESGLFSKIDASNLKQLTDSYDKMHDWNRDKKVAGDLITKLNEEIKKFEDDPTKELDFQEFAPLIYNLSNKYDSSTYYYQDCSLSKEREAKQITGSTLFNVWQEIKKNHNKKNASADDHARNAQLTLDFFAALEECKVDTPDELKKFLQPCIEEMYYPKTMDTLLRMQKQFKDGELKIEGLWSPFTRLDLGLLQNKKLESTLGSYIKNDQMKIETDKWRDSYEKVIKDALKDFTNNPYDSENKIYFEHLGTLMALIQEREPTFFNELISDVEL